MGLRLAAFPYPHGSGEQRFNFADIVPKARHEIAGRMAAGAASATEFRRGSRSDGGVRGRLPGQASITLALFEQHEKVSRAMPLCAGHFILLTDERTERHRDVVDLGRIQREINVVDHL